MSRRRQLTIPIAVAVASELEPGDRLRVESCGPGRVAITRVAEEHPALCEVESPANEA